MEPSRDHRSTGNTVAKQCTVLANKIRIISSLNHAARIRRAVAELLGQSAMHVEDVMMQDIVGDYDTPDTVPEWAWVEAHASYRHRHNGEDGIWEFIVNLARHFDDVPEKLRPVIQSARKSGAAYLVFHQGT
ncbi:hypothetical protein RQP54_18285 [Curvibacter sp. APW13]|uniref:hypothetical protein n=1 Tax=Curvibacter sp. APW13 TaxID=3077236 RepID=UPI0028DE4B59|nr:hypothetical protein [Curvibacter sp. APW13]MDT8992828.1 hypothetical protein [Curvibacter sp. APW13]